MLVNCLIWFWKVPERDFRILRMFLESALLFEADRTYFKAKGLLLLAIVDRIEVDNWKLTESRGSHLEDSLGLGLSGFAAVQEDVWHVLLCREFHLVVSL